VPKTCVVSNVPGGKVLIATYDHRSSAHGRLKIIAVGSNPSLPREFSRRYTDCPHGYLGTRVMCAGCPLTTSDTISSCLVRLKRIRSKPVTMLATLATIERELAIWAGDAKTTTWPTLVILDPLKLERTTPGMARKPTLALSITVDCGGHVRFKNSGRDVERFRTVRIKSFHPSNWLLMNFLQTISETTSSVHNFSISRR